MQVPPTLPSPSLPALFTPGVAALVLGFVALWSIVFFSLSFGRFLRPLRALALATAAASVLVALFDATFFGNAVASIGLLASSVFGLIQSISRQPSAPAFVHLSQPVPAFQATLGNGLRFDSGHLAGSAYLLKFYRGHWCPYCRLELQAWYAMAPELSARGIRFVAISPDTPREVQRFEAQHAYDGFTILSDAKLAVTERFGLRSHKTLAVGVGRSLLRPLAIPTTILVDAQGIVRWVDRSADHQVRSDPKRVLPAIDAALGVSLRSQQPKAKGSASFAHGTHIEL